MQPPIRDSRRTSQRHSGFYPALGHPDRVAPGDMPARGINEAWSPPVANRRKARGSIRNKWLFISLCGTASPDPVSSAHARHQPV